MLRFKHFRLRALLATVLLAVLTSSHLFAANHQLKRRVAPKPVYTVLPEHSDCDVIVLKLREGTKRPVLDGQRFLGNGRDFNELNDILSSADLAVQLRPRLSLAPAKLDEMRAEGSKRVGWLLPDLTLYYDITLDEGISAKQRLSLVRQLNDLELVELAYFEPLSELAAGPPDEPGPPEGKGPKDPEVPETPSFEYGQYYLRPAPVGFDAYYAWSFPGGRGENAKVIDIEGRWNETHEDLHGGTDHFHIAGDIDSSIDTYHGTAVLGIIAADSNEFGMTGMAYATEIGTISTLYMPVADAITIASANCDAGDIILLEQVTPDPYGAYIAVEYEQINFDAILTASALGRVVIEAAGNYNMDFDNTELYDSLFYPDYRYSGAIMIGMAYADHAPDLRTCYGQRLDVHGFGVWDVFTLGGGSLWYADDNRNYTQGFSGTSSASAEIAAVCAQVQSVYKQHNGSAVDHAEMRNLLTTYSVPQVEHWKNIGPMPDLAGICDDITGFVRPAAPALVSPDNEAYFTSPAQPTFDWGDVTGAASYDIMIDDNFSFISPAVYEEGLTISEWTPQALQQGKYFWRVRARNGNGFGSWSEARSILVDVDIQAPVLLSPEDGGFTTTCANVPLEWHPVDGVVDYIVEVTYTGYFDYPYRSTYSLPCEDGTCSYGVSYLATGFDYNWRVRALADDSPWSDVWSFRTKNQSTPRLLSPEVSAHESVSVVLKANCPNPFNPVTQIIFSLPGAGHARLEIFNILGQKVETLVDEYLPAGQHTAVWNAGAKPSGVYLYRLTTENAVVSKKMLLIK